MENCNASQILKEAIRTVVRHEMKKTSSKTDDREKNFINLEEELIFENRLVEIGLDLFLPTMAIQVAAGIGEFNQLPQELLETDFLNQSFHKIIQNKNDTRLISLRRIRDFCASQNA